jgi:purine nucleoside permease
MLALAMCLTACSADRGARESGDAPIPIKVVIVTMFETDEDTGDKAGEFQRWYERRDLSTTFPAPHMHHDIQATWNRAYSAL